MCRMGLPTATWRPGSGFLGRRGEQGLVGVVVRRAAPPAARARRRGRRRAAVAARVRRSAVTASSSVVVEQLVLVSGGRRDDVDRRRAADGRSGAGRSAAAGSRCPTARRARRRRWPSRSAQPTVASMVSEPPSSRLRAAPRSRLGGYRAPASMPPTRRPTAGRRHVVGPGQAGEAVDEHHDVLAVLDQSLRSLERQLGDHRVLVGGTVEGRRDDLALDGAAEHGDLFGTLVDEQHEQVDVGVVGLDRPGRSRLRIDVVAAAGVVGSARSGPAGPCRSGRADR